MTSGDDDMSMEVSCGQCHGQLVIDGPGLIKTCPHCGAHVSTPDEETPSPPDPLASDVHEDSIPFLSDPPTMIARGIFSDNEPIDITIRSSNPDEAPDFSGMSATTPLTPGNSLPRFLDGASPPPKQPKTFAPNSIPRRWKIRPPRTFILIPQWIREIQGHFRCRAPLSPKS